MFAFLLLIFKSKVFHRNSSLLNLTLTPLVYVNKLLNKYVN